MDDLSQALGAPPLAAREPYVHSEHGVERHDPYHWMREPNSPALHSYLRAEREWYDAAIGPLRASADSLRAEMASRVPAADASIRWMQGGYSYLTRFPTGCEYPQLVRWPTEKVSVLADRASGVGEGHAPADAQVVLDSNVLAEGHAYLGIGLTLLSPDGRLVAYSTDTVGDEVYRLCFREVDSGRDLDVDIPRSYYGGAWSADSSFFFYTVHDDAYRAFQVWRHELGTSAVDDVLVLQEDDERFYVNVRSTRSGGLVVIWSESRNTKEAWVIDANQPTSAPRSVGGRRHGVEYDAEHVVHQDGHEELLLVTNDMAVEYRLASAPVPRGADQDHTTWIPVRPADPAERLTRVDAFTTHVVLTLRREGHLMLRILPHNDLAQPGRDISPTFPGGTITLEGEAVMDAGAITIKEQSRVHPAVWSRIDLATGTRTQIHRQEATNHDPEAYVCEVLSFPSPDGVSVPATLIRRSETLLDGSAPALLYGYGSYEHIFEPTWDPALLPLLDRGVVYVHAHVRGGGEGGHRWWLDGCLEHKQHTFDDYLAVADGLVGDTGGSALVDGARLATRGLSAGGMMQGAVLNQRPDRWRAVVAEVPLVDLVSSRLDPSIPLTVNEWEEWGDPRREADFRWMLAYSPYDNLPAPGTRPHLLVTGALHDPRVMVFEPAKWVAALRHSDPAWSPQCLFRCEVGAGAHAGPSGRFAHLAYEAEIYAWILDRLSIH